MGYLNGLEKANNVGVIDSAENGNFFEQILTDFWTKQFLVNLFDCNSSTWLPVPGPPNDGERTRADSASQYVVSNQAGLIKIHLHQQKTVKWSKSRPGPGGSSCGFTGRITTTISWCLVGKIRKEKMKFSRKKRREIRKAWVDVCCCWLVGFKHLYIFAFMCGTDADFNSTLCTLQNLFFFSRIGSPQLGFLWKA